MRRSLYAATLWLVVVTLTFWARYRLGAHAELLRSQHTEQLYFQALRREKALRDSAPNKP